MLQSIALFIHLVNLFKRLSLAAVGLGLALLAFNHWGHSIPATFQALLSKGRISSAELNGNVHQEYQRFLEQYQHDLLSSKRYVLICATTIIALIPAFITVIPFQLNLPDSLLSIISWITVIFRTFLPYLLVGYLAGVVAWVMSITGLYIKNLPSKFNLTIQPSHPDNCGGLQLLGDFCLGMALPILIGATLLGIYGIGGTIHPGLVRNFSLISSTANLALLFFVLPLAAFAFFIPLWGIHRVMLAQRQTYEDKFADRLANLEQKIH